LTEINYYRRNHPYKFVLILGCGAGNNLEAWSNSFDTSCIIGFENLLYEDVANAWDWRFWMYVFYPNYTILQAANRAFYETYESFDYFEGNPEKAFMMGILGNGVL